MSPRRAPIRQEDNLDYNTGENERDMQTPKMDAEETTYQHASPLDQHIAKAKKDEEDEILKCRETLQTMKKAIERQRNISADVKNGILILEESLEVIASLRSSWKFAEHGRIARCTQTTPTVSRAHELGGKRAASSPAAEWSGPVVRKGKRRKGPVQDVQEAEKEALINTEPGTEVEKSIPTGQAQRSSRNGQKKKRTTKPRPEAILIKPSQGKSYAEVLGAIRSQAKPEDTGTDIIGVRKTRAGDVLLELGSKTENKDGFRDTLKAILGETASVRTLEPRISLELRDLDDLTTEEEVLKAVTSEAKELAADAKIFVTKANNRGQKMAIIEMNARGANELLKLSRIKIGWVYSRVRRRVIVARCFACFGYGHQQSECRGPNRRAQGLCIKCGLQGHKKNECKGSAKCFLCVEKGSAPELQAHIPGSGSCQVFRAALEKEKGNKK